MQFGVRQLTHFTTMSEVFPAVLGMSSHTSLVIMICIELICSVFIMFGFLTRLMVIPPLIAMVTAEVILLQRLNAEVYMLDWQVPVYLPIMFIGIYLFIMLVGPGKISVDYFYSLYLIHTEDRSEEELEEV